eukprot:5410163-Prymnesium_polylepis.1
MPWTEPGLLRSLPNALYPQFSQMATRSGAKLKRETQDWIQQLVKDGTLRTGTGEIIKNSDGAARSSRAVAVQPASVRPKISASDALQLVQRTLADLGASGT